ncbi:hypothetical protein ACWDN6_14840 [Streptomyces albogriseolus]
MSWVPAIGNSSLVNLDRVDRLDAGLISGNLWVVRAHTASGMVTLDIGQFATQAEAADALRALLIKGSS